ncbi:MAG: hypothetical protein RR739_02590 [Clostridia bacterium]
MDESARHCACEQDGLNCTSVAAQYVDVSVPLKLKPYAIVGDLTTECCGEPVVSLRPCPGGNCCCGCEITITQTLCVRIPVRYGANADVGDATSLCLRAPHCVNPGNNLCR